MLCYRRNCTQSSLCLPINNSDWKGTDSLMQNGTKEMEFTFTQYKLCSRHSLRCLNCDIYFPGELWGMGGFMSFLNIGVVTGRNIIGI